MGLRKAETINCRPEVVLFDLDNTLYEYAPAHSTAIREVRTKCVNTLGLQQTLFDDSLARARSEVKERLAGTASSHSRLLYFQRVLELAGLGSQVLLALDLEQTYWRTFMHSIQLFEGVRELLDDLRLLGIPTGLVTDLTAQIQLRKLLTLGLDSSFDYVVTSEEAGFDKPHQAPYQLISEKLQLSGREVWMIGDSLEADVQGARNSLGATALQKVHQGVIKGDSETRADFEFLHFSEVRRLLENLENVRGL